ncbi:hypothetical protein [Saccharopolyspora shandongensis]|uniref:hypothetical protein n=1 Tax=Saccharopolyspora shandongensis TaxID=418495 RepID=UPI0033CEB8B8
MTTEDQGARLREIEARWTTAVRAGQWQAAEQAAADAEQIGMTELAAALRRETIALEQTAGAGELAELDDIDDDQADEQPTVPDDVYERACDDVRAVLAERFGGGSISDDTRLTRCLDAAITTAYVLGCRDAYTQAAERVRESQRRGEPLASLIRLREQFEICAALDEQRAGGDPS